MAAEIVERGPRADLFDDRRAHRPAHRAGRRRTERRRRRGASARRRVRALRAQSGGEQPRRPHHAPERCAFKQAPALDDARFALWDAYTEQGEHAAGAHRGAGRPCHGRRAARGVSRGRVGAAARTVSRGLDRLSAALQSDQADAAARQRHGRRAAAASRQPGPKADGPVSTRRRRSIRTTPICSSISATRTGLRASIRRPLRRCATRCGAIRPTTTRTTCSARRLQASGATDEGAREKDLARRLSSTYSDLDARRTANSVPRGLERAEDRPSTPPRARAWTARLARQGSASSASWCGFHLANGRRLFQAERDAEALAELRRAVFLSPYESEAHLLIGRILLRGGRAREAIDTLKISVWSRDTPAGAAGPGRGLCRRARLRGGTR